MKDIEVTSTALYYIAQRLDKEIALGYLNNIQLVKSEQYLIKLKLHKQGTRELIITPRAIFMPEHNLPVDPTPDGLIKFLKKKLCNQRIQEVRQDKNNRVVYLLLDDYYLIFELFSNSNIILTDLDFKIVTSKQKEEWKDRVVAKNQKYLFPANKDIKEKTIEELEEETKDLDLKKTIGMLVKEYNVHPWYLLGLSKEKTIENAKDIYQLSYPVLSIVEFEGKELLVVKEGQDTTIEEFFSKLCSHYLESIVKEDKKEESGKVRREESILESQSKTKKKYQEIAEHLRKEGEFIYSNFSDIEEINRQIRLAREKKIQEEEIIKTLNECLSRMKKNFLVVKINLKDKTYTIDVKDKSV